MSITEPSGSSPSASVGGPVEEVAIASGSAARWRDLVAEHERYIEEKRDTYLTFVGAGAENRGEIITPPYTHRWTSEYTEKQYAEMQDFVRGAREEYENPYVVMLPALTASTTTAAGEYRPPIDVFDALKQSWARGVRYELHHSMEADREKDDYPAREWEYITIWEPTTEDGYVAGGYPHLHPVVVCDGRVKAERFASVLEKHVEKCGLAEPEAHAFEEVDIQPLDAFANPAAYLFKYLGKSWNREDVPDYQRRFDALLYETGYRRFQPSDGAQRWMKQEHEGSSEPWIYAGIADADQVETLEEYEDAAEFRIDREMGIRAYLAGREAPSTVDLDVTESTVERCEHPEWYRGRCVSCGVSRQDIAAGFALG